MIKWEIFVIMSGLSLILGNLVGFNLGRKWRTHRRLGDLYDILLNNKRGELSLFLVECFDLKSGEYGLITPYIEDNERKSLLVRKYELRIRNEDTKYSDRLFYLIVSKHTVSGENRIFLSDANGYRLSFTDKQIHFLSNLTCK